MPFYKVWYRNSAEALEFSSAARVREEEIIERILARENIAAPVGTDGAAPSVGELIKKNNLAPVRYAEDEGEPYTIV
ncbi:MAG: hypothetical protein ABW069_08035 [Duganella sp.]